MLSDSNPTPVANPKDSQSGTQMAPEAPKEMTMEEKTLSAVEFLHGAIPSCRSMINNGTLTGVQAKRVLCSLVESPLEEETPEFTTKEAHAVFNLACMIQNAKYILFQGAPTLLSDVEKKAAEEQANVEANAETNNEEVKE